MTENKEPRRGVQLLLDVANLISAALVADGLDKAKADDIALMAADRVRHNYGGEEIYIPRGVALIIERRDAEVFAKFDGSNHFLLAHEYNLTVRQIYTIVERVRRADFAKRQMGLFS